MTITPSDSAAELPAFPIPRAPQCPYRPSTDHVDLREVGPKAKVKLYNGRTAWLVTGAAQARAVLSDYRRVSIRPYHGNYPLLNEEFEKVVDSGYADVLFGVDPPEHTKQRQMIMPRFSLRQTAKLRDDIQRIVDEKLDDLMASQPADLVTQFAQPVPSMVMSLVLGVPYDEHEEFETPAHKLFVPELAEEATAELGEYLDKLITKKEKNPGQGLIGLIDDLIEGQLHKGTITRDELVHIAMAMLVAGTDTTTNVISLGTAALLDNDREQWEILRGDPDLVGAAVEEILRYVSLVEAFARVATDDIELPGDGGEIKAGEGILISCAGVNFDPNLVPDPDKFDITRPAKPSFSFSHGIHRCPGDNLARLELEIAFRTMVERMPNLNTTTPIDQLPSNNNDGTLQRLYELPVVW